MCKAICPLSVVLAGWPGLAAANDMAGITYLTIGIGLGLVLLPWLIVTLACWFVVGAAFRAGTARSFLRMLVVVVVWMPVPGPADIGYQAFWMPWSLSMPFLSGAGTNIDLLTTAVGLGSAAVLGACLITFRSWAAWRYSGFSAPNTKEQ